jgi:hydroxymethylglutaryl-CoA lyase
MSGTDAVLRAIRRAPGSHYPVLVPNALGMERALAAGADEVAVFISATESFSRRNINCSIAASLERVSEVVGIARGHAVRVRGYVSCVLGCPYEGAVPLRAVAELAGKLAELGCYEISLGDTIGAGTPHQAREMVRAVASNLPMDRLAIHFHDTFGQALANVLACVEAGVGVVDSAVGGLGGCPYADGASGNLATEDLLYMLDGLGVTSGVDMDRLLDAVELLEARLGIRARSRLYAARRGNRTEAHRASARNCSGVVGRTLS